MHNGYDNDLINIVATGEILKWTNYIHGWQVRHFRLSNDGYVTYCLTDEEMNSPRGIVNVLETILQIHQHSEVRFDMVTPSTTWYLRCLSPLDRRKWLDNIQKQQSELPMSESGSLKLLTESSVQVVTDLHLKLDELNSFKNSLSKQLAEIRAKVEKESPELGLQLATVHATVGGIVATTATCIDLLQEREQYWKELHTEEREKSRHIEILYNATNRENKELIGHNLQQGPHLNEDEFFDAVESTLVKLENIEEDMAQLEVQEKDHWMYNEMQTLIKKYTELSHQDPDKDASWKPLSKDDHTRIYRKEEERDNVMVDFLVATTTVEGVTAAEMAEVFHTKELKLKWDHTIDADKLIETLDEHCSVIHQIQKRIWPAAQRDIVYASHKQKLSEDLHPDWIVCNKSCEHKTVPEGTSGCTRATIEVVLYCKTICDKPNPTRKDLKCKIVYSATVNPGGWAPASAVRAVSQREYPKFLKKISAFAKEHVKNSPIKF